MNNNHIWCVIMAGGAGTRFWPLSTVKKPKQFLNVADSGFTFLSLTREHFKDIAPDERTIVVTSREWVDKVYECLPSIPRENVLAEPYRRDTSTCIAYAMYTILKRDPDAVMVVTPSDHLIFENEAFTRTILDAVEYVCENDVLMTIGVRPSHPDTNYGYIQGSTRPEPGKPIKVKTFMEKPDAELARVLVESGEFLWNSGIFVWRADTISNEYDKYLPQTVALLRGWQGALGTPSEAGFIERAYADCAKISVDYAIMEHTTRAWVYPAEFGWYDIGTWESLYAFMPGKDAMGNASNVQTMLRECQGNLLLSTNSDKLIAVRGLDGYVIVDSDDVLLVCPREDKKSREFLAELAMPKYERYR